MHGSDESRREPAVRGLPGHRLLGPFFVVLGILCLAVAFLAERLSPGGASGFGLQQSALAAFGLVLIACGVFVRSAAGRRRLARWQEPVTDGLRPADFLVLAAFVALLTGLLEGTAVVVRQTVLHQFTWTPLEAVWMAPLGYLGLMAPLALLAWAARRILPGLVTGRRAFQAFASLGLVGLLLEPYERIHPAALVVLGLGAAAALAGAVGDRIRPRGRLVRRSAGGLALIALAAWLVLSRPLPGGSGGDPEIAPEHPNVLLIILDTVRARSLSLYGHPQPTTPFLERLAERGVTFDHAFSPSPWTLPAHGSLFTGRYTNEMSTDWRVPLDDTQATLAEVLGEAGYATAGFAANPFNTTREAGIARGFAHFRDFRRTPRQIFEATSLGQALESLRARHIPNRHWYDRKDAAVVTTEFLRWLRSTGRRPFFAFLNLYDAHKPYHPPPAFRWDGDDAAYGSDLLARYHRAIAFIDRDLETMLAELGRRGELDHTIVIVSSDHGELFGEHGLWEHGNALYRQLLRVPLLVTYPGAVPEGVRVDHPVTLRDIAATVLDLTGVPPDNRIPGASLARYWNGSGAEAESGPPLLSEVSQSIRGPPNEPIALGDMESLVDGDLHYIRNGDGSEELYDMAADPDELRDLTPRGTHETELARFRVALRRILAP
ncbi:MAG: sulfatase [Gemmatimonadota bacterium]